jgi:NADP-dependent 3-hydroxy acid dehydrogenase YdfG
MNSKHNKVHGRKTVLATVATSGIGKATARGLAMIGGRRRHHRH